MLDPGSLNSFLPEIDVRRYLRVLSSATVMRRVWVLLTLSLWSTVFHIVLLFHVRSTAQQDSLDSWKRRKKVLYYYANQNSTTTTRRQQQIQNGDETAAADGDSSAANGNVSAAAFVVPNEINARQQQWRTFPGEDLLQQMRCISDGGNGKSL